MMSALKSNRKSTNAQHAIQPVIPSAATIRQRQQLSDNHEI